MKLTKRVVDTLNLPARGAVIHWDEVLPGFGVRLTARGSRAFVVDGYANGTRRRVTIGRYGILTVDQARNQAKALLADMARGVDPIAQRKRVRAQAVTLRTALADYLKARSLKPLTRSDIDQAMKALQDWLEKPVAAITPDMVRKRHAELGMKSEARANLVMRYLRAVLAFAMAEYTFPDGSPVLTQNPVRRLSETRSWYRVSRRQTMIAPQNLRPWMKAVASLANETARDFLLLVLLTGLRRGEALGLKWDAVDFTGRTLTLADTKANRRHVLPLSDALIDLLQARRRATPNDCAWVFADGRGRQLSNLRYALETVTKQSDVEFCVHDLRRTFATVAESLDIPAYALKRLLNHATGTDVTAGYLIVDTERLRAPMQRITDFMLRAGHLGESSEVVLSDEQEEAASG